MNAVTVMNAAPKGMMETAQTEIVRMGRAIEPLPVLITAADTRAGEGTRITAGVRIISEIRTIQGTRIPHPARIICEIRRMEETRKADEIRITAEIRKADADRITTEIRKPEEKA